MLTEVAHAQDGGAVGLRVEVAQALGITYVLLARSAGPLGIGEDIDVRFTAVAHGLGALVHLHIFIGLILEIEHPVVEKVLLALGNQQMGLDHELRVQTDEDLCVIHGLPAGVVYGIHEDLVQSGVVDALLAGDAAGRSIASGDGAVVEQQYLGIRFQTEFLTPVDRHIGDDGAGRVFRQVICLPQGIDFHHVVAVKRRFDDGAGFGKTGFARTNLTSGVVGFRGHLKFLLYCWLL